ncbi:MAG: hypothetical protein [Caudoviricetes sp.]|nr:MAG: hypothetical protein [Caudoviricetes sp.]
MRKSLIMGTREDVIKRRAKQATAQSMPVTGSSRTYDIKPKQYIVTFNHPILGN